MRTFFPLLQPRYKLLPPINATVIGTICNANVAGQVGLPILKSVGVRSSCTVTGISGSLAFTVAGVRCNINVSSIPGVPKLLVISTVEASAQVAAQSGSLVTLLVGSRSSANIAGSAGVPILTIVSTAYASTQATALPGTPVVKLPGFISVANVAANNGTFVVLKTVIGVTPNVRVAASAGTPTLILVGVFGTIAVSTNDGKTFQFSFIPPVELFAYVYARYVAGLDGRQFSSIGYKHTAGTLEERDLVGTYYSRWS